jgi:hypothetical protein
MIEEVIYVSAFNVKLDGTIEVRKTTDVTKDGAVIASSYWRTVLQVNDPAADEVLGAEGYYRQLAADAWAMVPAPLVAEEVVVEPVAEEVVTEEPTEEPTSEPVEVQSTEEGELSL